MIAEKRLQEDVVAANLPAILTKVAQEFVPRIIVGADEQDRAVLVNPDQFRRMQEKAAEFDSMTAEPEYAALKRQLLETQARAKAYAEMLDRVEADVIGRTCPRCQRSLRVTRKVRLTEGFAKLKVSMAEAAAGLNPSDLEATVVVAGVGGEEAVPDGTNG